MRSRARFVASCAVALGVLLTGCAGGTQGVPGGAQPPPSLAPPRVDTPLASPAAATTPVVSPVPRRPVVTPCTKNRLRKYVFVSIRRQQMWMCARNHVALQTPITTGRASRYTNTPTGRFTIQGRMRNTTLTPIDGSSYAVKYWIPFQGSEFGFHDSSWQHFPYGSAKYRTHGSHGCVHMPLHAIAFLYRWGDTGTPVRIKR